MGEHMAAIDFAKLLQPHLQNETFYLPSFGPVYYKNRSIDRLVKEVLAYWDNKTFLPYDKGRRWLGEKEEYIYVPELYAEKETFYVPVINTFGKPRLKVFVYSKQNASYENVNSVKHMFSRITKNVEISSVSMISDKAPAFTTDYQASNLYFKVFTNTEKINHNLDGIHVYSELPPNIQKTFMLLANEDELFGSQMLWHTYLSQNKDTSPMYVAVEDETIVGMIGPMDTLPDFWNSTQLLAPYFEVSKKHRRKGFGVKLWQSAMSWAYQNGAEYLFIQAEQGKASDHFYQNQGLTYQSTMYTVHI